MIGGLARRLFGSANDRYIKNLAGTVDEINALEPEVVKLSDADLAARTVSFRERLANGESARRHAARRVRHGARGGQAHAGPAPFRRAAHGRHRAASRHDRRNEDRRRQDAGRDPARLSQRPRRQGRACRHRQRLPGQARQRMDGPDLSIPGPDRRLHRPREGR